MPEEIGSLARLQSLALCDNQIVELPDAIVSLSQLKSLQLHSNQLQALPRALLELDSITSLSLRNNPLVARFVREMVFSLPSLQELSGRAVRNYGVRYRGVVPPHLERWVCLGEVGVSGGGDVSGVLLSVKQLLFIEWAECRREIVTGGIFQDFVSFSDWQ